MTWEERMYMRAIMASDPSWAKAIAEEMAVPPRDRTDRETWIAMCEVERLMRNLAREAKP